MFVPWIQLTLKTASGRVGRTTISGLGHQPPTDWDRPWVGHADGYVREATFELHCGDHFETMTVDGDAWRELKDSGDLTKVVTDASASTLELALRARVKTAQVFAASEVAPIQGSAVPRDRA
jgi:hypothetical protein